MYSILKDAYPQGQILRLNDLLIEQLNCISELQPMTDQVIRLQKDSHREVLKRLDKTLDNKIGTLRKKSIETISSMEISS